MQKTKPISKAQNRGSRRPPPRDLSKVFTFHNSPILQQQTILSILNDGSSQSCPDGCFSILSFIQNLQAEQHLHYYSEDYDQMDETQDKKGNEIEQINARYRQAMENGPGRGGRSAKKVSFKEECGVKYFGSDDPPSEFWKDEENVEALEFKQDLPTFSQE